MSAAIRDQDAPGVTPTVGTAARRAAFWVCFGIAALLIALVIASLTRNAALGSPLAIDNAAPPGSMALAEVLHQQGVEVTPTASMEETMGVITDPVSTTLLIYDPGLFLDTDKLAQLPGLADRLILVDPGFDQLQALAPAVAQAGRVDGDLHADCGLPAVQRAGVVSGEAYGYRIVDGGAGAMGCLRSDGDIYSLVEVGDIIVFGTIGALTNGEIADDGNAALALNLLGEHEHLVWYLPSFADVESGGAPPPTAPWLPWAIALLFASAVAAAFWRGRRLGPLVIENLPVTVRASETMLGRARLYERSGARLRALDALRVGAVQRIAQTAGLSRHASVDEVVASAAALTDRPVAQVRALLVDDRPATDADLVRRSDELTELERAVTRSVRGR